jgi:hypothetical protein
MTFPDAVHPERADKLWRLWCSKLNRFVFAPRWHKTAHGGVVWARSSEFQVRGVLHFHALMGAIVNLNLEALRVHWKEVWLELADGYSRIHQIENRSAVIAYITKYVVKGGELELSGNLNRYVRQRALELQS